MNILIYIEVIFKIINLSKSMIDIINELNQKGIIMEKIKIFISHSSKDADIIKKLIFVLQNSISGLSDKNIRCTSVNGYKFKSGTEIYQMIKEETNSCELVISAFSENALQSSMVQFETGIAWFLNKAIPIIIEEDLSIEELPKPFQNKQTKYTNKKNDLLDLIDDISEKLNLEKNSSSKISDLVNEFINEFY